MIDYHDNEWGAPVHNDKKLFEILILDGAQAGLSWETILTRRENYRKAFDNFNPITVSKYNSDDIKRLINDKGIIRNKLKIMSAINNSKRMLEIQKEFGSFDKYMWSFTDYKTIVNSYKKFSEIPPTNQISIKMSKDMKKRGFTFVGPTICYAIMQSIGMVNDHEVDCFRHSQIKKCFKDNEKLHQIQ